MNRSKGFMIAGASAVAISLVMTGLMEGALLGAASADAATDMCVATNGAVRVQKGSATCQASGKGSMAKAKGTGSSASATGGDHNKARARGDGSRARRV